MEYWIIYAIISLLFAGITSVIAKFGMKNINRDTALEIQTSAVFIFKYISNQSAIKKHFASISICK